MADGTDNVLQTSSASFSSSASLFRPNHCLIHSCFACSWLKRHQIGMSGSEMGLSWLLSHTASFSQLLLLLLLKPNPSCEATPFASEMWPFKRGGVSCWDGINTFMFLSIVSTGIFRRVGSFVRVASYKGFHNINILPNIYIIQYYTNQSGVCGRTTERSQKIDWKICIKMTSDGKSSVWEICLKDINII